MKERPNHTVAGLIFVTVCVLIAAIIYLTSRAETQRASANMVELENVSDLDLSSEKLAAEAQADANSEEFSDPSEVGQCRDDECAVGREVSRQIIRSSAGATLIRVSLLGGTANSKGSVRWEASPHDVYVFCSVKLPAVVVRSDDEWQVDVLDQINGPPTVLDSSQRVYANTCHGDDPGFPGNASSLGYRAIAEENSRQSISEPNDLFAIVTKDSASLTPAIHEE